MLKIHNLTPSSFHTHFQVTQSPATTLSDYSWALGLPFSFDESSYLCEVEFPKGSDIQLDLSLIDWVYLSKNKSKKLILTHRIIYPLDRYITQLNEIILKHDLKGRVFWLSMNPHDFKLKNICEFELLFLDSLTHVILEFNIAVQRNYFKARGKFNLSNDYTISARDPSLFNVSLFNDIESLGRIPFINSTNYFLSASRVQKAHRLLSTYLLNQIDNSKSIITFHGFSEEHNIIDNYLLSQKDHFDKHKINFDDVISFKNFRGQSIGDEATTVRNPGSTSQSFQDAIESCLFQYVNESTSNEIEIFITEKTWANYLFGRPFVMNGNKGTLTYLNKYYGFKSFDGLFDESYDLMDNFVDRVYYGVEEVKKLCSLDFYEAKKQVESLESIYEHNFNIFKSINFAQKFLRIFDGI